MRSIGCKRDLAHAAKIGANSFSVQKQSYGIVIAHERRDSIAGGRQNVVRTSHLGLGLLIANHEKGLAIRVRDVNDFRRIRRERYLIDGLILKLLLAIQHEEVIVLVTENGCEMF